MTRRPHRLISEEGRYVDPTAYKRTFLEECEEISAYMIQLGVVMIARPIYMFCKFFIEESKKNK